MLLNIAYYKEETKNNFSYQPYSFGEGIIHSTGFYLGLSSGFSSSPLHYLCDLEQVSCSPFSSERKSPYRIDQEVVQWNVYIQSLCSPTKFRNFLYWLSNLGQVI